eukprot:TRINITY_DN9040_c0_g1_i11.p3 TRINITY_DN9040_c0_g1~~TRINITY_DN9040_c0_g1_i11.p3  ORF type:complete len:121 (-),score=2.25 TRINITY_DN9040_c0_g1_i11:1458-1820(-)
MNSLKIISQTSSIYLYALRRASVTPYQAEQLGVTDATGSSQKLSIQLVHLSYDDVKVLWEDEDKMSYDICLYNNPVLLKNDELYNLIQVQQQFRKVSDQLLQFNPRDVFKNFSQSYRKPF